MFKSIYPTGYVKNYDDIRCVYSFRIIDDDFEQDIMGLYHKEQGLIRATDCAGVAIKCYENRSLPVARNIILLFNFFEYTYRLSYSYPFDKQRELFIKNYPKYTEELEKYLLLI